MKQEEAVWVTGRGLVALLVQDSRIWSPQESVTQMLVCSSLKTRTVTFWQKEAWTLIRFLALGHLIHVPRARVT